jgi:hypothetical protein
VWASTTGRRRGSGVTAVPSRIRLVAWATAASTIHGSADGTSQAKARWSQTNSASQPADSAACANSTTRAGSAYSPKMQTSMPYRIRHRPAVRL